MPFLFKQQEFSRESVGAEPAAKKPVAVSYNDLLIRADLQGIQQFVGVRKDRHGPKSAVQIGLINRKIVSGPKIG